MNIIHAIVFIQNWGNGADFIDNLKNNPHVISLFHIMGRHSYLMDVNFDDKTQLGSWIGKLKSITLSSGVPALIAMETQKIIEVLKSKSDFGMGDYRAMTKKFHFFMKIDNPHHDEKLIALLSQEPIVFSNLHVQGENSFVAEVITDDYGKYKNLLMKIKKLKSVHHIETQEVISVLKYRNTCVDESGTLIQPGEDIREMYTL